MFKTKSKKIDFIGIGAQKSGTTALDYYLRQHPDIEMPKNNLKEIHFFDNENNLPFSDKKYRNYHKHFSFSSEVTGEITPIYCFWDNALKRIWEYKNDIKIIFLLRNPIDRAYSHWNMETQRGAEVKSFSDCIRNENLYVKGALPYQDRVKSYVSRGLYVNQIRTVKRFFEESKVFFVKYEEFKSNQEVHLNSILEFLNVDPSLLKYSPKQVHKRDYAAPILRKDKEYLLDIYEYEILQIERELGWDCTDWKV